jgi:hypothetical protein
MMLQARTAKIARGGFTAERWPLANLLSAVDWVANPSAGCRCRAATYALRRLDEVTLNGGRAYEIGRFATRDHDSACLRQSKKFRRLKDPHHQNHNHHKYHNADQTTTNVHSVTPSR